MLIDNICFSPSSTIRQQCWSQRTWRRWSKYPSSDPGQPRTPRCLEHPYLSCRTGAWWRTGCPWCSGGWWSTCAGMVRKVCGDLLAAPCYHVFYSLSAIQEEEPHWSYSYHNLGVRSFVYTHFSLLGLIPFRCPLWTHNITWFLIIPKLSNSKLLVLVFLGNVLSTMIKIGRAILTIFKSMPHFPFC